MNNATVYLLECWIGPAGLCIVINHLTEADVVDVISTTNSHIKLAVEDVKLHGVH